MHCKFSGLRLALLVLVSACMSFAQRDLATLEGRVTDSSGGVVANAKVTITEPTTNQVYVLATNSVGEFVRPALRPATYIVSVTAPGFKKAEQKDVLLTAGERTGVNITLTVGDIGQTVEVTAEAAQLQTESTQVGADLNTKTVAEAPLGGQRNITYLARLSPNVLPAEPGARDANNGGFSANGVRSNGQNNFLLNGVDNNINTIDFLNQTAYAIAPSPDAISEISIQTNGYTAEYGRAAGGVVNVSLKSGTNAVHGSLYEFLQNRDLDSNSWQNNRAGSNPVTGLPVAPRGPFVQNQFGATAGGPIIKNKLFIFGDYQGTRIADSGGSVSGLGYSGQTTIPTPAEVSGNFQGILGPTYTGTDVNGNPLTFQKGQIYDPNSTTYCGVGGVVCNTSVAAGTPLSRTAFPGNTIPASRMDPASMKLAALFPAPNQTIQVGNQPTNDYFFNTTGSQTTDQGDGRVDYRLSDKNSLFGSLSWSNTYKTDGAPLPGFLDDTGFSAAGEFDLSRNAQISFSRVWSPTIVTESRASFTRLVTSRFTATPTTDAFKALGIGGYDPSGTTVNNGGLPNIGISGYVTVGAADWIPTKEYNNVWDFVQNVAISKGTHAIKVGAEFRSVKFPFFQVPDPHGNLGFSNNETSFPSANKASNGSTVSSLQGDGFASLLLGQLDSGAISTTNFISSQKVAYAGYVQDDWKLSPRLTVNLGLRYELWSPIGEQWGRQANYDLQNNTLYIPQGAACNSPLPPNFSTLFPTVIVDRCHVSNYLIPWDKLDFGPRVGLAYKVNEKTVIRLGFGIFYGGEENQGGSPNRGEGVPFNETVNLSRTQGLSGYIGISQPACTGCDFFPGGLSGGYPASPFTLPAGVSMRGVQPDFENPYVSKWNVIVQRELPSGMALELGYEGNHQAHQVVLWNSDTNPNFGTTNSAITGASLQEIQPACPPPTCQSVGNGLSMTSSFGFGNYAAGSVKLEKRFSHGLQFITSYVWSHTLANSGTPLSGSSNLSPITNTNFATAYSSAGWDIRHSLTTQFNYELPFGRGKQYLGNINRFADLALGGWQTNGILTLRTGVAITMAGASCQGVWNRCEPDYVPGYNGNGDSVPSTGRTPNEWFDTSVYQVAAPLTGGNVGLQTMTGPPTKTMDFSIFKTFAVTERFKLQFRGEAFNLGNFTILNQPDVSLGDSKSLGGNGNFGVITGSASGTERHLQFSLRLSF